MSAATRQGETCRCQSMRGQWSPSPHQGHALLAASARLLEESKVPLAEARQAAQTGERGLGRNESLQAVGVAGAARAQSTRAR
jgi:hypothetical protein